MKMDINDARPGMKAIKPVLTREGGMLVDAGTVLTPHLLDLFDLWGVLTIDVDGTAGPESDSVPGPASDGALAPDPPVAEKKQETPDQRKEHIRDLSSWIKGETKRMFTDLLDPKAPVDAERLKNVASTIVDESIKSRDVMASMTTILDYDTYLFSHSVHVAVLSVIVGVTMELETSELRTLALGGLVHDAGMMKIPKEIWLKKAPLTDDEFDIIKNHPVYGERFLERHIDRHPDVLKIVRQHHERMDGSGYPDGRRGRFIHPLARITAVCDVYEAMQASRAYRRKWLPYQVVSHLLVSSTETLDADVVKAFLRTMSAYPIGSLVRLDTGEVGVVVSSNPQSPIRPAVKIFLDKTGTATPNQELIDLGTAKRFIVGPVDPDAIGVRPFELL